MVTGGLRSVLDLEERIAPLKVRGRRSHRETDLPRIVSTKSDDFETRERVHSIRQAAMGSYSKGVSIEKGKRKEAGSASRVGAVNPLPGKVIHADIQIDGIEDYASRAPTSSQANRRHHRGRLNNPPAHVNSIDADTYAKPATGINESHPEKDSQNFEKSVPVHLEKKQPWRAGILKRSHSQSIEGDSSYIDNGQDHSDDAARTESYPAKDDALQYSATSTNERISASAYNFRREDLKYTISEDRTTNACKRRKEQFIALELPNTCNAKAIQPSSPSKDKRTDQNPDDADAAGDIDPEDVMRLFGSMDGGKGGGRGGRGGLHFSTGGGGSPFGGTSPFRSTRTVSPKDIFNDAFGSAPPSTAFTNLTSPDISDSPFINGKPVISDTSDWFSLFPEQETKILDTVYAPAISMPMDRTMSSQSMERSGGMGAERRQSAHYRMSYNDRHAEAREYKRPEAQRQAVINPFAHGQPPPLQHPPERPHRFMRDPRDRSMTDRIREEQAQAQHQAAMNRDEHMRREAERDVREREMRESHARDAHYRESIMRGRAEMRGPPPPQAPSSGPGSIHDPRPPAGPMDWVSGVRHPQGHPQDRGPWQQR